MRGKLLIEEGRYQEGIAQEHKAMEIDPFQRPWGMVYAYLMSRNFDAAIAEAEQRLATRPDAGTWFVAATPMTQNGWTKRPSTPGRSL